MRLFLNICFSFVCRRWGADSMQHMLCKRPIGTEQLSLIQLFDIKSDYTRYMKQICLKAFTSFWFRQSDKNVKFSKFLYHWTISWVILCNLCVELLFYYHFKALLTWHPYISDCCSLLPVTVINTKSVSW